MGEYISFGCRDHERMKFRILREGNKTKTRITPLEIRREDLELFVIVS